MRLLLALLITMGLLPQAFAADRAAVVQGRITGALANVLPRSDYLVIVNRLDELEDGGQSSATIDGVIRPLPGLSLGVDSNGQVVNKDASAADYNGPVVISLLIDPAVKQETFALIQKTIPELSGGLRDMDEFKVARASLRQTPVQNPNAPQVNVQNSFTPKQDEGQWSDLVRHAAVLLLLGGILVWFMARMSNKQNENSSQASHAPHRSDSDDEKKKDEAEKVKFDDLDATAVALYLLKELQDRRHEKIAVWAALTSPNEQRRVLKTVPGWAASYLEKRLSEEKKAAKTEMASSVYREIAVVEQNLTSEVDCHRAFLMWFPAPSLRLVPRHQLESITASTKGTLMRLRQDLGALVRVDDMDLEASVSEPSEHDLATAWNELKTWKSREVVPDRDTKQDLVKRLANVINGLTEFGPIMQQLESAKAKISEEDFARLNEMVVSASTPLRWDTERVKAWLREVDPQDYQWWLTVAPQQPDWDFATLLRPLRRSMFERANEQPAHLTWPEATKKQAAVRILQQLRAIHQELDTSSNVEAS